MNNENYELRFEPSTKDLLATTSFTYRGEDSEAMRLFTAIKNILNKEFNTNKEGESNAL